jgi:uncharacterized protein HemX
LKKNSVPLLFALGLPHDWSMQVEKNSLEVLRDLITDTDLTLETIPDLPQNRTAHCRENLRAALGLVDDMLRSVA